MKLKRRCLPFLVAALVAAVIFASINRFSFLFRKPKKDLNCTKVNIEDLINFSRKNLFQNGIPKIVHYTYKDEDVPSRYAALVKECQRVNDDVLFVFWSDSIAHEFIKRFYPRYIAIYESYLGLQVEPLKKSDIIRYFVLETLGGVYMDMDTRCQRPLRAAMTEHSCIIGREVEIVSRILWNMNYIAMNSFMASVPGHRIFAFLIDSLRQESHTSVLYETGPIFLTKSIDRYRQQIKKTEDNEPLKDVFVASSDLFSPYVEPYVNDKCRSPSEASWIQACNILRDYRAVEQQKIKAAVVVHLYLHLGYEWGRKRITGWSNICDIAAVVEPSIG